MYMVCLRIVFLGIVNCELRSFVVHACEMCISIGHLFIQCTWIVHLFIQCERMNCSIVYLS